MVVDVTVSRKEVLAFLIRASQLAEQALQNLSKGNPYDAVRLIRLVAKLDINVLNVLVHVPNYESVKPYHVELINECKAILALSQTAINQVSPELKMWPAEKLAKYTTLFQSCLEELDKEVKAEKEVEHWLKQAEQAFMGREKVLSYSRSGLERVLESLNWLVEDENAIKQSIDRFSKVFKGVKHQDPEKLVKDLITRRLEARNVVKYILEHAFRSVFTFQGHDWLSELRKVSGLPEENIKELEAIRQQLLSSSVFIKRNLNYAAIKQLLEKLVAVSQHARRVERAITIAEELANRTGKGDEEILKEHWETKVRNGLVYHGTSSIFLTNIERFGLSSEQIFSEGTPFKPEDYEFFLEVSRRAYGAGAPHIKYFTQDVTQGFFLEANYNFAVNYAKQGPERIRFMLEHIRNIEIEFKQGKFGREVSQQEVNKLLEILRKYEQVMLRHKPVVLHIHLSSPVLLAVLSQNGWANEVGLITNYESYRQYVIYYLNVARGGGGVAGLAVPTITMAEFVERHDPIRSLFHNRPLKGTIPWASIAKAEYV